MNNIYTETWIITESTVLEVPEEVQIIQLMSTDMFFTHNETLHGKDNIWTIIGNDPELMFRKACLLAENSRIYNVDPISGKKTSVSIPNQRTVKMSVLIPMYLSGKYITEAVTSVYDQKEPDCELIVVDDGSTDQSLYYAAGAIHDYKLPAVIIAGKHRGQAASRNTALKAAEGEWIFYLDADDVLTPGAFTALFKGTDKEIKAICAMCEDFISPELSEEECANLKINPEPYRRQLAGCLLIRKSVYDEIGFYDETLPSSETAQWMLRMSDAGIKLRNIDDITLRRRYHRNNFGRRSRRTQLESYMAIIRQRRSNRGK